MKVVKPKPVTDANLLSSNVPETDYAAWSAATTYSLGQRVIRLTTHRVYESLKNGNLNKIPENTTVAVQPVDPDWLDVSATNRWAMFDEKVSTKTVQAGSIVIELSPQNCNSVSLFGLEGSELHVTLTSPTGAVVYTHVQSLEAAVVTDWYEYFFSDFKQITQVVLTDLPMYYTCTLRVEIIGTTAACGHIAVGAASFIGELEYGATAGIIDYSKKETDVFGNTTFLRRANSKRMTGKLWVDNSTIGYLQRTLEGLTATPCVWVGTDSQDYEPLVVFGWYKDFQIEVAYHATSYCSLEIEGLI